MSSTKLILLSLAGAGALVLALKGTAAGGRPPSSPLGLGDVDGDGIVSMKDAELVGQYSVGNVQLTAEQHERADVNCDGIVNIVDALLIAQYAEGSRASFPCEET